MLTLTALRLREAVVREVSIVMRQTILKKTRKIAAKTSRAEYSR